MSSPVNDTGQRGAGMDGFESARHNRAGKTPTVIELIKLAGAYLEERGVESSRLSAEHLLAMALRCNRLDLYLRFDERPGETELARFRADLKMRARHYPLQYLLGEIEFHSLRFSVREGVFIPRPETELLIERVSEILEGRRNITFIEFGVGAGVISGTLAAMCPGWGGVAFDISPTAAALARENFVRLGVSKRVQTVVSCGFEVFGPGRRFDLLVANPPYIPAGTIHTLQKEVSMYEDRAALDGGEDGTRFYPLLAYYGKRLLRNGGAIVLEIGDGQGGMVGSCLESFGFERTRIEKDYNGFERVITAFRPDGPEKDM